MTDTDEIIGMFDVLAALEEVIMAADPAKREQLAKMLDAYHENVPEDFHWALGAQSPMLLFHLFMSIDSACRPDAELKRHNVIRLVDRKPEGNA